MSHSVLFFSYSDVVRHSSSRELPRATVSLGLNTSDPEAVQLDPAMNLDQSQSPLPSTTAVNANYQVGENHGGTTEEGNCSYLLPRAAAAGSNGTNKGQIHKVPVDEIAQVLVYRMDVTRSQLSANTGIPGCLVREIWQFKIFTGKKVTPLYEEGKSQQFRAGKKATHFHYK